MKKRTDEQWLHLTSANFDEKMKAYGYFENAGIFLKGHIGPRKEFFDEIIQESIIGLYNKVVRCEGLIFNSRLEFYGLVRDIVNNQALKVFSRNKKERERLEFAEVEATDNRKIANLYEAVTLTEFWNQTIECLSVFYDELGDDCKELLAFEWCDLHGYRVKDVALLFGLKDYEVSASRIKGRRMIKERLRATYRGTV